MNEEHWEPRDQTPPRDRTAREAGCLPGQQLPTWASGISITLDRYGHLMPGIEKEAAGLLDTHLAAATSG